MILNNAEAIIPLVVQNTFKRLMQAFKDGKKKVEMNCKLCDQETKVDTLKDLFIGYGRCIFCVYRHLEKADIDYYDFFVIEVFLLEHVDIEDSYSIENTLHNTIDLTPEIKLAEELSEACNIEADEPKVKFFICQEINSLTYLLYDKNFKVEINILLVLLYLRQETKRYLEIWKTIDLKNLESYKLAILLLLEEEETPELEEIIEKVEYSFDYLITKAKNNVAMNLNPLTFFIGKENIIKDSTDIQKYLEVLDFENKTKNICSDLIETEETLNNLKIQTDKEYKLTPPPSLKLHSKDELKIRIYGKKFYEKYSFVDFDQIIKTFEDFKAWNQQQADRVSWNGCVKLWAENREKDLVGLIDSAMIDVCTAESRHEDGWLIYSSETTFKKACVTNAANLCLKGLKFMGDEVWISRVTEVIKMAANSELLKECCEITTKSIGILCSISEDKRVKILEVLKENLFPLTESDELISCFLDGILRISTKCKTSFTCKLCTDYAYKFYCVWKQHKKGYFFMVKKTEFDEPIISSMLGVCAETNNCDVFYKICEDAEKYETRIEYDVKMRLEKFHCEQHKGCEVPRSVLGSSKELIKHFLKRKNKK